MSKRHPGGKLQPGMGDVVGHMDEEGLPRGDFFRRGNRLLRRKMSRMPLRTQHIEHQGLQPAKLAPCLLGNL